MRAVRIHEYGGPDVLTFEDAVPEPAIGAGDVLVQAIATSVNPIDWKVRSGSRQKDFPLDLPAILGRDVCGVVNKVGSDVTDFAPGDLVLAFTGATYAELVAVPAADLARLPQGLDPQAAAALPLATMTGDQLVRLATRVEQGDTVIVSGALGSVGRAAVYAAKKMGAKVIAGVRKNQVSKAEALGVDAILAIDDEEAIAAGSEVDAVADTVGGDTAARLLRLVRAGGRFGYASVLPEGAQAGRPDVTVNRVSARPDAARLREFAEALQAGSFELPVSETLDLRDAAKAHERLERGGGGKIVLAIGESRMASSPGATL